MKYLFFFIGHPERALAVAILMLAIAALCGVIEKKPGYAFGAAGSGLLFAIWEIFCMAQRSNIRVDLLLIIPFLFSVTIMGLASVFFKHKDEW